MVWRYFRFIWSTGERQKYTVPNNLYAHFSFNFILRVIKHISHFWMIKTKLKCASFCFSSKARIMLYGWNWVFVMTSFLCKRHSYLMFCLFTMKLKKKIYVISYKFSGHMQVDTNPGLCLTDYGAHQWRWRSFDRLMAIDIAWELTQPTGTTSVVRW